MDSIIHIETSRQDRQMTVKIDGELDIVSAVQIDPAMLLSHLEDGSRMHVDLTGLTFMDSTGLSRVLQLHRAAKAHGIPMVVYVADGGIVHRVMRLVGAADVLTVVPLPFRERPGLANEIGA